MNGRIVDQVADAVVAMWPDHCDEEHIEEVMRARASIFIRKKYGSFLAMFLISVIVNQVVRIIVEWWLERDSHRVLMEGWSKRAKETQDLQAGE